MRVSVVSDIHGNLEYLHRAADRADFLIVLGDLLQYVDYRKPEAGIFGRVFGPHASAEFAALRVSGRFDAMHSFERDLWMGLPDPAAVLAGAIREQYCAVVEVLGPRTLVTLGNVDSASEWNSLAPEGLRCRDAEIVELDGLRFGFVAGGALREARGSGPWTFFERSHDHYRSIVESLGKVDVLCTHVPPDIKELRFDVVAQRSEMYGPGLLEAIDEHHPSYSLFGHVHRPRATVVRRGPTTCVNVGLLNHGGRAFGFDTDRLHADQESLISRRTPRPRLRTSRRR